MWLSLYTGWMCEIMTQSIIRVDLPKGSLLPGCISTIVLSLLSVTIKYCSHESLNQC